MREQANQFISHIETFTAILQNLENNTKAIKPKTKSMEMYPEAIQIQMFKSATVLDSDDFRAIFKFFRTWLHCEMEIVMAVRQSKERA